MASEVGKAYVTLIPSARGFASAMQRELAGDVAKAGASQGEDYGERFSKSAASEVSRKGKSVFSGLAKAAAAVGGAAVVGKLFSDSISAASDLGEVTSKAGQIFGKEMVPQLEEFASTAATAMGQSKTQALDAASTFAIFGKAAGLSGDKLVKFSTDFTGLASDLASFHNASPQEAIEAIGAALRGEAEPMRRFGVMMDDASLKAEALSLGLLKPVKDQAKIQQYQANVLAGQQKYNESVKEFGKGSIEALKAEAALGTARNNLKKATEGTIPSLTAQQKTLAAQSLIFKQTKDAQGDFSRTSDGMANQQRILTASFEDAKIKLGQGLLPIVTKVFQALNDAMPTISRVASTVGDKLGPALETAAEAAGDLFGWMKDHKGTVTTLAVVLGALVAVTYAHAASLALANVGLKGWIKGTRIVTALTKVWAAVQWALNAAMSANPIGLIIVGIIALVAALVLAWKKSETFRAIVTGAFDAIREAAEWAWDVLKTGAEFVWNFIKDHWALLLAILLAPFAPFIAATILIVSQVVKHWDSIVGFFKSLPGKIGNALKALGGKLRDIFVGAWRAAKNAVVRGAMATVNFVASLPGRYVRGLQTIGEKVKAIFERAWDLWSRIVQGGIERVVDAVTKLPQRLMALGGRLLDAGRAVIGQFVDGLKGAGQLVSDVAGNVWDAVKGMLNDAIDKINDALDFEISIPGPNVHVNIPDIPTLAGGGRATRATLAIIGEGREPETVLPDSMLRGLLDRATGAGAVGMLTITNWREGTGYFRLVAEESMAADHRFRRDLGVMHG